MSFSIFNSFNGNSCKLGQNYSIVSQDINPPTTVTYISADASSVTFSFTAPTTTGTILSYTPYINGKAYTGSGTPSSYTINGLTAGTQYTINMVANIEASLSTTTVSNNITNFSPTSVSGLQLWFDALDPNGNGTVPANGSTISTWYDKSGGSRNATAASPITYNSTGLNNKPALTFSNAQQLTGNVSITTPTLTIFAICSLDGASTSYARVIGLSAPNTNDYGDSRYMCFFRENSGIIPLRHGTAGVANNGPGYSIPSLFECWYDGTKQYATVQKGNSTSIVSSDSSGNFGISAFSIGVDPNRVNNVGWFSGFMSEILVYNTSLSVSDRQKVEGYLSWKWGLQTNLPTAHPYYSAEPTISTLLAFTPKSISGCIAWWDGADPNGNGIIPSNNTAISTWKDKSGNGYDAIGASSATYSSADKCLLFNNSGYETTYPANPTNETMFVVFSVNTLVNWMIIGSSDGSGYRNTETFSNGYRIAKRRVVYGATSSGITLTNTNLATSIINYSPTSFTALSLNGGTISESNSFSSFVAGGYLYIGKDYIGNQPGFNGKFMEILIYNKVLTSTEYQKIEGYLAWKWGIQILLPLNHPHYSVVPTMYTLLAFTPKSISGCAIWLDAADTTTIAYSSGSKISQWNDKSGNGYSVVQSNTSFQPTYGSNLLNGKGGIQLSPTGFLYQNGNNIPLFSSSAATTVFIVAKNDSSLPSSGWSVFNTLYLNGAGGNQIKRYHLSFAVGTTTGVAVWTNNTQNGQSTVSVAAGANAIIGTSMSSTSTVISVNGTSSSYAGVTLPNANDPNTFFIIGDSRNVYIRDIVVYEMIGFNVQLSTSDHQKMEGYLAWKWGAQTSLP